MKGKTINILLIAAPFIGYLWVYNYEIGFLSFYDVPKEVIDITFINILDNLLEILFLYFILIIFTFYIFNIISSNFRLGFLLLITLYYFLIYVFVPSYFVENKLWKQFIFVTIFYLIIFILIPIIQNKKGKNIKEKLAIQDEIDDKNSLTGILANKYPIIYFLIFLTIVGTKISFFAGFKEASEKVNYMLIEEPEKFVVIRKYENLLILSILKESKIIENNMVFTTMNKITPIKFTSKEIGPLIIEKNRNDNTIIKKQITVPKIKQ